MKSKIRISRIVTNVYSSNPANSKDFYTGFLGMELLMDMEWILTFASKESPGSQISILRYDKKETLNNDNVFLSIEVSDVDALYTTAIKDKLDIVYKLTDEPWGVRRFFVKEPNGATINILQHIDG